MSTRNLVHFFNSMGVSTLTVEHQEQRIADLERENERLKRLLAVAKSKLSANSEISKSVNPIFH